MKPDELPEDEEVLVRDEDGVFRTPHEIAARLRSPYRGDRTAQPTPKTPLSDDVKAAPRYEEDWWHDFDED